MITLTQINIYQALENAIESATVKQMEDLYYKLDQYCVDIEKELIELGEWEADD